MIQPTRQFWLCPNDTIAYDVAVVGPNAVALDPNGTCPRCGHPLRGAHLAFTLTFHGDQVAGDIEEMEEAA